MTTCAKSVVMCLLFLFKAVGDGAIEGVSKERIDRKSEFSHTDKYPSSRNSGVTFMQIWRTFDF